MRTPSVSVIIPTHNRQTYLRMSLNALARQSYPANQYEVVVVLDGCTDGSLEMLRNFRPPYRLQILEQEQKGASTARNHGARLSTGDLLVFLDDDVEATPGLILAHAKAHGGQNSRVAIGYYPPALAGQKALLSLHLLSWWEEMFHDMRETGHRFCHQDLLSGNLSIPRDIYQRVGGFDPDLPMREDFELGMRLIQADVGFTFVPQALGLHHEQAVITKSIRRKYVEGIADVRMGRKHPELIPTLLVRRLVSFSYLPSRLLQQLEFHSPRLVHWIATVGLSLLPGFERAHLVGLWRRLLYGVLAYWYWKGVTQELSTWKAIQDFLAPAMARETVSSAPEVIIDLSLGFEPAEQTLDRLRPESVEVYMGKKLIGLMPDQPGAERWRGAHLRPYLIKHFMYQLLEAYDIQGMINLLDKDEDFNAGTKIDLL